MRAYRDSSSGTEPIALIAGRVTPDKSDGVPTRIHDSCFTSEVIGSLKCDCKDQLEYAMDYILRNGPGVIIYLQQEGRGIGLANKILAYALQEHGVDTVDANTKLGFKSDARQYACVPHILKDCGVNSLSLMTNNPRKIERLRALDVVVKDRIPIVVGTNPHSEHYLQTKAERMGHFLATHHKSGVSALFRPSSAPPSKRDSGKRPRDRSSSVVNVNGSSDHLLSQSGDTPLHANGSDSPSASPRSSHIASAKGDPACESTSSESESSVSSRASSPSTDAGDAIGGMEASGSRATAAASSPRLNKKQKTKHPVRTRIPRPVESAVNDQSLSSPNHDGAASPLSPTSSRS